MKKNDELEDSKIGKFMVKRKNMMKAKKEFKHDKQ